MSSCIQTSLERSEIFKMDKLTLISGTLFLAADIFAIVSLAMPDWIITDVGGKRELFFDVLGKCIELVK